MSYTHDLCKGILAVTSWWNLARELGEDCPYFTQTASDRYAQQWQACTVMWSSVTVARKQDCVAGTKDTVDLWKHSYWLVRWSSLLSSRYDMCWYLHIDQRRNNVDQNSLAAAKAEAYPLLCDIFLQWCQINSEQAGSRSICITLLWEYIDPTWNVAETCFQKILPVHLSCQFQLSQVKALLQKCWDIYCRLLTVRYSARALQSKRQVGLIDLRELLPKWSFQLWHCKTYLHIQVMLLKEKPKERGHFQVLYTDKTAGRSFGIKRFRQELFLQYQLKTWTQVLLLLSSSAQATAVLNLCSCSHYFCCTQLAIKVNLNEQESFWCTELAINVNLSEQDSLLQVSFE